MARNTNPSATKKGPGRRHEQGYKRRLTKATPQAGADRWFEQHTNPQRATKRALRRELGSARQVRKHLKTWRREQIEAPEAL